MDPNTHPWFALAARELLGVEEQLENLSDSDCTAGEPSTNDDNLEHVQNYLS